MPRAEFGERVDFGSGLFRRLKNKGDSIEFRLAGSAVYEGKHFSKDENGKWTTSYCPRIMTKENCEYCNKYDEMRREANEIEDEAKKKKALKEANNYKAKIIFYYPVLERTKERNGKAKILQTTLGIRQRIEVELKAGVDVMAYDYVLTRDETPPQYYSLVRKEKERLTAEEKVELKKAASIDIEKEIGHDTKESSLNPEQKEPQPTEEEMKARGSDDNSLKDIETTDLPF